MGYAATAEGVLDEYEIQRQEYFSQPEPASTTSSEGLLALAVAFAALGVISLRGARSLHQRAREGSIPEGAVFSNPSILKSELFRAYSSAAAMAVMSIAFAAVAIVRAAR